MAGKPDAVGMGNLSRHVAENAYYAKTVIWAYNNGIVNGTPSTTFALDAYIIRA